MRIEGTSVAELIVAGQRADATALKAKLAKGRRRLLPQRPVNQVRKRKVLAIA